MYQEVSEQFNITSLLFVLHLYYVLFVPLMVVYIFFLSCLTWLFATCTTVQNVKKAFPKEIKISLMTCYIESFATWMEISLHEDSPTKMTSWWLSDYYNLILKVKGKKTCVLEYLCIYIVNLRSLKYMLHVSWSMLTLSCSVMKWCDMLYFIGEYNCLIKLRTPEKECQILFVLVFLLYMFFKVLSNLQIEPYQFNNNCLLKREEDNI